MRELVEGQWAPTGRIDPEGLSDPLLELHWAAQAAAGVGRTFLPPLPDSSHHAFEWAPRSLSFVQGLVAAEPPFRSGIRPRDLALVLFDSAGEILDEYPLHGRTLDEGYRWMAQRCAVLTGEEIPRGLARPDKPLPPHSTAEGGRFSAERAALVEIARYYHDADIVLRQLAAAETGSSPVRLWPHNFDIATLITLSGEGETARTVGVGMVAGDDFYEEPYYYVTPFPYPDVSRLRPLASGRWHIEDWTGAVLTAGSFSGEGGRAVVEEFLREAVSAVKRVMSQ